MWEFCNTLSLMPLNNTSLLNRNNIRKRNFRLYRQIAYNTQIHTVEEFLYEQMEKYDRATIYDLLDVNVS